MANRTVKDAQTIRGTNPQYLVEKIVRTRIYDSKYWKEECFALTAELLVDKAMELKFVGGVYGGNMKPAPFLCLLLKMLQIQPEKAIVVEFIGNEEFKYVRALGAFYLRLTATSLDSYKYLEPLLNDYRKIRRQNREGKFFLSHMDEFIESLLREERVCDIIMPRLQKRHVLEENNELEPRVSALEDDLDDAAESSSEEEEEVLDPPRTREEERRHHSHHHHHHRERRSRSRSHERRKHGDRDRRRTDGERHRKRDGSRSRESRKKRERSSREREHRKERREGRSGHSSQDDRDSKETLSVSETNKLRAQLGLPPLK